MAHSNDVAHNVYTIDDLLRIARDTTYRKQKTAAVRCAQGSCS